MTSQSPRIYIYKITFEEVLYYYYGVKKERWYDEEYWGSPVTHKWCWELYTPEKQILELFDYTDEGYVEAQGVEKRLIKPVYNTDKWCLNRNCGGLISPEMSSYGGKKGGKTSYENKVGIHGFTPEEKKFYGRKSYDMGAGVAKVSKETLIQNGKTSYELKLGVHGRTKEQMSKDGKKSYEMGLGIHGLTLEQRIENGKRGGAKSGAITGKRHYEEGTGIFSLSPEEKLEVCSMGGKKTKELGLGIYGLTPEQKSENGKRGGTISSTQRWECTETGYITTSGPLTAYQRAKGIDTSKRVRIS